MAFQPRIGSEDAGRGSYRSIASFPMPSLQRYGSVVKAVRTTFDVSQGSKALIQSVFSSFLLN